MHVLQRHQGSRVFRQKSESETRSGGTFLAYRSHCTVQFLTVNGQKCFDCVEKQLATDPVNEEVYEKATTAFVPLDSSAGNYPEYWSNNTARSAASHAVSIAANVILQ